MSTSPTHGGEDAQGIPEVFADFGWEITPEWVDRYNNDAWVFNLTNALVAAHAENERLALAYIEASNPGIDMEDVRRIRAERKAARHGGRPSTDDEFGITLDPCEHPSVNGGVCAVCGAADVGGGQP